MLDNTAALAATGRLPESTPNPSATIALSAWNYPQKSQISREVWISVGSTSLPGELIVPGQAEGLVLFAHGSGWQVAGSMTAELVIEALKKVNRRECPQAGVIVHSDRGGQYVDTELCRLLKENGFEQSMSRAKRPMTTYTQRASFRVTKRNCSKTGRLLMSTGTGRNLRLHRRLLQSNPQALGIGLSQSGEL